MVAEPEKLQQQLILNIPIELHGNQVFQMLLIFIYLKGKVMDTPS
jgi:hypothetical protein